MREKRQFKKIVLVGFLFLFCLFFNFSDDKIENHHGFKRELKDGRETSAIRDEVDTFVAPIIEYELHDGESYSITYIYYEYYRQLIIIYTIDEWGAFDKRVAEFRILCAKNNFILNEKHRWFHIVETNRVIQHHRKDGTQTITVRCTLSM